jgi:glycosyltransferase involved in cell wall biosynthesis
VLFISPAAFNRTTGGGITFGNLFAGWPKDRLATVHNDPIPTTTETCEHYYRLGPREIRRWGPLERIAPAAGMEGAAPASPGTRSAKGLLQPAKRLVFGDQLPDTGRLSAELAAWIEAFRPEVLYTILGTNAMMELVDAVQRRYALPFVVHMMDDWPASSYRGGALGFLARARMERLLRDLMRRASVRMGICEAMSEAYAARYGAPFVSFQNTVDVARWEHLAKADLAVARPADVVYVGSILPGAQLETLVACAAAVEHLAKAGVPVRLSLYSPAAYAEPHRARLVPGSHVELHDTLTDDDAFFRRIAGADALLLPVNFTEDAVRLLRYSMPTKVPAYLASGTPILACGPRAAAQIRYAEEAGWGSVVSEPGVPAAADGLRRILVDADLRKQLSLTAREIARKHHDSTEVRAGFQRTLAAAARNPAQVLR